MAAENFYDDSTDTATASPAEEPAADNSENTALLPKSFFQGKELEPGGRCEIEIVRLHNEEAEVRYVSSEKEDESESDEEEPPMPEAPPMRSGGMGEMME